MALVNSIPSTSDHLIVIDVLRFSFEHKYLLDSFDGGLDEICDEFDEDINRVNSCSFASGGNGHAISIPQLKTTIAKALEILIAKLHTKPQTKEDLVVQGSTSSINNQQHNSKNV